MTDGIERFVLAVIGGGIPGGGWTSDYVIDVAADQVDGILTTGDGEDYRLPATARQAAAGWRAAFDYLCLLGEEFLVPPESGISVQHDVRWIRAALRFAISRWADSDWPDYRSPADDLNDGELEAVFRGCVGVDSERTVEIVGAALEQHVLRKISQSVTERSGLVDEAQLQAVLQVPPLGMGPQLVAVLRSCLAREPGLLIRKEENTLGWGVFRWELESRVGEVVSFLRGVGSPESAELLAMMEEVNEWVRAKAAKITSAVVGMGHGYQYGWLTSAWPDD